MAITVNDPRYARFEEQEPSEFIESVPIVDVDTHISEPPDLWTSRVSTQKWGDLVPHVQWIDKRPIAHALSAGESGLAWLVGDEVISMAPAGAAAKDILNVIPPDKPKDYEDTHPAAYITSERLKLMNDEGIYAMAVYPNVGGFGSQAFLKLEDPELRNELVRAYNDFQHDWAAEAPERFILNAAMPFWDVDECVREVYRCKEMGFRGILFASRPNVHGAPWIADEHWDPLWQAATETGLPINFHIGSGNSEDFFDAWPGCDRRTLFVSACTVIVMSNARALVELTMSGVLQKYPELRFVSVESGVGWEPYIMEAMDHEFNAAQLWKERPEFEMLPSEYYKRQIYSCFWFEESGPKNNLEAIGEDRILFETDFPHTTKLYPAGSVRAHIMNSIGHHPQETQYKLLAGNAANLYGVELPVDQSWRTQTV